ncbi:hypothetical protein BC834DRAFT_223346 [Gloeopeniophorella convolvens]|nr:hypothetical protein BC834DRAFT_223346 [Gloeopeniophorella convolvens]
MHAYRLWKPSIPPNHETDRPRHKPVSSSLRKNTEPHTSSRNDTKHPSSRGYVSEGHIQPSHTPAPTYPSDALASTSKAPHITPAQSSQTHAAYASQRTHPPNAPAAQDPYTTSERHPEPTYDSRTASHRPVATSERAPLMPTDQVRYADDRHKPSHHRSRDPPVPAPARAEPQSTSIWPLSSSFLKKGSPEGRDKDKEQSRSRPKDPPRATPRSNDKERADRATEQALRDQQEQLNKYEEERRRQKEERRREKEERRREERRQDERRYEQRVRDEYPQKATRDQERRHEVKGVSHPVLLPSKDPRLARVKDSDESDNSLMKPQGSIRPRRHHRERTSTTPAVPTVLRQTTHPTTPPQPSQNQPEANTVAHEPRRAATLPQTQYASVATLNEKPTTKPQKGSPSQNLTVPYPPGYAVSTSDSERASRREHRAKAAENGRSMERPRTSGGHRTSVAYESASRPNGTQPAQQPAEKRSHKPEKHSKSGLGGWLFHRETSNAKVVDTHTSSKDAAQPTPAPRAVPPPPSRNDTSGSVPQVISIRAGEGPSDSLQEFGVRRPTAPTVPATSKDSATRQGLSATQASQHPQALYDKHSRGAPRAVIGTQPDPPIQSQAPAVHPPPPQPWVQPAHWLAEPQPTPTVPRPAVVPSPMVFAPSLVASPAPADAQRHAMPSVNTPALLPRAPANASSYQPEPPTQPLAQENPWHTVTTASRTPAPTYAHSASLPVNAGAQRVSPKGVPPIVPDVVAAKPLRHPSAPVSHGNGQPSNITPVPSRPIAPDLAAAFPIREDNLDGYRQHSPQGDRLQIAQMSRDGFGQMDRHAQEAILRVGVSTVPSSERTPRSTKASPTLHPRPGNQGTPPKPQAQPIPVPVPPTHVPVGNDSLQVHDSSRSNALNMLHQNSNSSAYPNASVYPSLAPRTHLEAITATNNVPVSSAPVNNPSPKTGSGNPSPRSRSQPVAAPQGPPQATIRTPSHDTGSTTLLGQTPSSQGSMLMPPMSPIAHPQTITQRAGFPQQSSHSAMPTPESSGDRNVPAATHPPVPATARQPTTRHHHSASVPSPAVISHAQPPPPVRSQTQPVPRALAPVSPTPVRSYSTAQAVGDPYAARIQTPGHSTPAPNAKQRRNTIPSPSQESELNTPSSLAVSTKLPVVSDQPVAPVMSTQSYQEPKKKSGFFQGLGLFRSKSSAQKQHPHESKAPESRSRTATAAKRTSPKSPMALHYDSDSRAAAAPTRLKKPPVVVATHTPAPVAPQSSAPQPQPQPPQPQVQSQSQSQPQYHSQPQWQARSGGENGGIQQPQLQPQPSTQSQVQAQAHPQPQQQAPRPAPEAILAAAVEQKISAAPNAFASFRIVSKRYRTMSGASAEALDGTNAGASTVLTSPANSTRSPTPKLIPPQRDPQQATYAWRNREEAQVRERGAARRRRPGVHFEGYDDHPQAERHRLNYASRARGSRS